MKRTTIALLAACSITSTTFAYAETHVAEVPQRIETHARSNIHSAIGVQILRFEQPIPELSSKIANFRRDQINGKRFSTKDASRYFSSSDRFEIDFDHGIGDALGNQGTLGSWSSVGVPVTTMSANGRTKTTKVVSVKTGAVAFVSASQLGSDHRAEIQLKIHQIVSVSETETSPYFGDTNARLSSGEMLPIFWTNNGVQYAAFLKFQTSEPAL